MTEAEWNVFSVSQAEMETEFTEMLCRRWVSMWAAIGWLARHDMTLAQLESWADASSNHLVQHRRALIQVQTKHDNLEVDVKKLQHKVRA